MKKKYGFIVLFLFPAVFTYTIFYIYPLLSGFRVIFYESVNSFLDTYVGWKNFQLLFGHETFRVQFFNALKNNFTFLAISLIGSNILGLIFAYTFSIQKLKGAEAFRNILFSPQIVPIITVGFICSLIFNPSLGTYDKIIKFLQLPHFFTNLLGKPQTALYTIGFIEIIRLVGFPLMIYFVAMNDISEDIIAAARIDGASEFTIFPRIVIPIISPTIIITNILMFIGSFIYFDLVYVMQGYLGGPAFSTDVLGIFFYRTTFGGHHGGGEPGIGAVIAVCMFFILTTCTLLGFGMYRLLRKRTG